VDPGLFGCIATLVWVLHRHGTTAALSVPRHGGLRRMQHGILTATRLGVAAMGSSVFMVAITATAGAALPGLDGPVLYLSGVGFSLALLIGIEAAVLGFRRALVLDAVRQAAKRKRPRSVQPMMRLGLGPRSEQLL